MTDNPTPQEIEEALEYAEEKQHLLGLSGTLCLLRCLAAAYRQAQSGRTVSCVCRGDAKIERAKLEAKAEAFEEISEQIRINLISHGWIWIRDLCGKQAAALREKAKGKP